MQYLNDVVLGAAEQVQLAYAITYSYISWKLSNAPTIPERHAITRFYNRENKLVEVYHPIGQHIQTQEDFIRALLMPLEGPERCVRDRLVGNNTEEKACKAEIPEKDSETKSSGSEDGEQQDIKSVPTYFYDVSKYDY